ncbi:Peroxidase 41 [Abeliophyllum distichum]|uniref:Peroxidase n=1 Tax=Abeliophyllum distichum TaxID=126358 RepID=A0ABD1QJ26_9LAMI
MAFLLLFFLLFTSLSSIPRSESMLTLDYYAKTCPRFDSIVQEIVHSKQTQSPTTAAATLRLLFHDCAVDGCDASVLIRSSATNKAERETDINHSLAGDAFDVVSRIKTALELECPGVVSCSDILAMATRNLITMTGGPHYKVRLGRKDGLVSQASHVEGHISRANHSVNQMITTFQSMGFTVQEMVALTAGGHTIGFAHCSELSTRLFGIKPDPALNPKFAEALKRHCANYTTDPTIAVFLDVVSPGRFDNNFLKNLQKGLGILASDSALMKDPRTVTIVDKYAKDNNLFFRDFARAMEKLSVLGVKTGHKGEVRKRCDLFNNLN